MRTAHSILFVAVLLASMVSGTPHKANSDSIEDKLIAIEIDRAFDGGSGVTLTELSGTQVESLVILCKVWGFLKYHHPTVTGGKVNWDYELFRVLPAVLQADDPTISRQAIRQWALKLGTPPVCEPCAEVPSNVHLNADVEWIYDRELLGQELVDLLEAVYKRRPTYRRQFHVRFAPLAHNAIFTNEAGYGDLTQVDSGYRLLALFRYWNIIQYWFPYRDIIGEDWDAVLAEFVPKAVAANDRQSYRLMLTMLIARLNDSHARLMSAMEVRPPWGACQLPIHIRFIDDFAVVARVADGMKTPLLVGDVMQEIDGVAVAKIVEESSPFYSASNETARLRDIARSLTKGECGPCRIRVKRGDGNHEIKTERIAGKTDEDSRWPFGPDYHDRQGDAFQQLSDEIGYLKLSSVTRAAATSYIRNAQNYRGLVIDIRNYPSEFIVFALGQHLVNKRTLYAKFTRGNSDNPGAFTWVDPISLAPRPPHYDGRVVILIDEVTQSQAEYTTMAFRSAPDAIVVGSATAGADGNVTEIALPGGEVTQISGAGVFCLDGSPTQRVGIIPDVKVRPTIEGLRAGRDEVLEEAIRQILGPGVDESVIIEMAKP